MSAWMFNGEGIDRAVAAIRLAQLTDTRLFAAHAASIPDVNDQLAAALIQMNAESLRQLYGDPLEANVFDHVVSPPRVGLDNMQACKTLHCFSYQCAEGTVPETALYLAVSTAVAVLDKLTGYDADPLPEPVRKAWEAATWG